MPALVSATVSERRGEPFIALGHNVFPGDSPYEGRSIAFDGNRVTGINKDPCCFMVIELGMALSGSMAGLHHGLRWH